MSTVIVPTMKPLVKALMRSIKPFSPLSLFANGEEGAWYDPSDLTTLYQDNAGTTPVTADGDPVGLMLDKSQGLVIGPEGVTNGDFSDGFNGWTEGGPNHTIVAGRARIDGAGASNAGIYQDVSVAPGSFAKVRIGYYSLISGGTDGRAFFYDGANFSSSVLFLNPINTDEAIVGPITTGTLRVRIYAPATDTVFDVDDITAKELAGNHASQSTASSRRNYRTDGTLHWLQDDLTDDALTAALPDLGTDATLAYADASGVTILTGQTISGNTDLPTTAETYGVIYLDRALTVEETASVTSYLNSLRGA